MAVKVLISYFKKNHNTFIKKVAHWRDDYGIDGIDLDIEAGAGSNQVLTRVSYYWC